MNIKRVKQAADLLNQKQILKKKVKEWKRLQVYGDVQIMSDLFGISRVSISRAVNLGEGSLKLLTQVNGFYEQRKSAVTAN